MAKVTVIPLLLKSILSFRKDFAEKTYNMRMKAFDEKGIRPQKMTQPFNPWARQSAIVALQASTDPRPARAVAQEMTGAYPFTMSLHQRWVSSSKKQ